MQIGILGSGNIGANAARLFARAGHHVRIANSRGPASLKSLAEEIGANAEAASAQDAVDASDVVLIAVPWTKREEALGEIEGWDDKIVIDAMNPYTEDFEIEDLGSKTATEFTRALVPGARRQGVQHHPLQAARDRGETGRHERPPRDPGRLRRPGGEARGDGPHRRDRLRRRRQRRADRGRPQAAARLTDLQRAAGLQGDEGAARPRLACWAAY